MCKDITIRMATIMDAQRLLEIYAPYVTDTSITFEYTVPTIEEFKKRIENILMKYPYLVAEKENKILGYAYAGCFKSRAAYDWSVETSIYIDKNGRNKGIGKKLYFELEKILKKQNITNVNACITYPNPSSIGFHEHMGYRKVAHFTKCGYKFDKWHDMIWMEKIINDHKVNPLPFVPIKNIKIL